MQREIPIEFTEINPVNIEVVLRLFLEVIAGEILKKNI